MHTSDRKLDFDPYMMCQGLFGRCQMLCLPSRREKVATKRFPAVEHVPKHVIVLTWVVFYVKQLTGTTA